MCITFWEFPHPKAPKNQKKYDMTQQRNTCCAAGIHNEWGSIHHIIEVTGQTANQKLDEMGKYREPQFMSSRSHRCRNCQEHLKGN